MARRRQLAPVDDARRIEKWYRRELAAPAVLPTQRWEPARIGPSWQIADGRWVLPELTLGWDMLTWCGRYLQHSAGVPWRFTLEQARILLWWFALTPDGEFLFRDGVLQRLKGWGKDPLGATLLAFELLGPARVDDIDGGRVVGRDVTDAWVQTAAVALDQTKNTMRLFPTLFTPEAIDTYRIQIGKEQIYALGDSRFLQAVTSSPTKLEGPRTTAMLLNETQHWNASNGGHEMSAVIERNATKSSDGASRTFRITNAFEPGMDSVAERDRDAYENVLAGRSMDTGLMYDSLEAAADAPLNAEDAPAVVESIRGDSVWLNTDRIVKAILDTRNPPSRSRRFWYNQVIAAEDAWTTPQLFDAIARPDDPGLADGEPIALFFDGSKSDDATALCGVRMSDGHVVTLGMWQRPPGSRGDGWLSPRDRVDERVAEMFDRFRPVGFFADPSHTVDDETAERYWDGLIDEWHRRYKSRLKSWAKPGRGGHAVLWDMASPARSEAFTAAAERCASDIENAAFTHDGDDRLRLHVKNARRAPNRWGVSLRKEHRESSRKIDLAVTMVGARMVRRLILLGDSGKQRTGNAYFR